jgi:hypothetical protein
MHSCLAPKIAAIDHFGFLTGGAVFAFEPPHGFAFAPPRGFPQS